MACKETGGSLLIDDKMDVPLALSKLNSVDILAVDCEGDGIGRKGEMTIMTIATSSVVYIFDTLKIGKAAFGGGLKGILEDNTKEKLMFDCRRDADSLWHQYKVKLSGIMDLQLLEVMHRMDQSPPATALKAANATDRSSRDDKVQFVHSYLRCLELYNNDENLIDNKKKGKQSWESDKTIWRKRPLSDDLLNYCEADTRGLFGLFEKIKGNGENLARLRVASERYADLFRNKSSICDDRYQNNAYLPLYIIPEKGTLSFPMATMMSTTCVTCYRPFPIQEFSKTQLRKKMQQCRVCKRVKRAMDLEKKRLCASNFVDSDED